MWAGVPAQSKHHECTGNRRVEDGVTTCLGSQMESESKLAFETEAFWEILEWEGGNIIRLHAPEQGAPTYNSLGRKAGRKHLRAGLNLAALKLRGRDGVQRWEPRHSPPVFKFHFSRDLWMLPAAVAQHCSQIRNMWGKQKSRI